MLVAHAGIDLISKLDVVTVPTRRANVILQPRRVTTLTIKPRPVRFVPGTVRSVHW